MCCVELAPDRLLGTHLGSKGFTPFINFASLMGPNKGESGVSGCHCPRDMAVRMREVLTLPWVGV